MEKKKILIIDDEEGFTHMIKLNLETTGKYEVVEENKGSQGVATAKACNPDLILLDIIMPDLDGSVVARQLREDQDTKGIPVVFLTVVVQRKETEGSFSIIGGYPFVAKPVNVEELVGCIDKHIRKT
jgi:DNA-binding response OmpR family regulator